MEKIKSKNQKIKIFIGLICLIIIGSFAIYSSKTIQQFSNLTIGSIGEAVLGDEPLIVSASVEPIKIKVGDTATITVEVQDKYGIEKVSAIMPHDRGADEIQLSLINTLSNQKTTNAVVLESSNLVWSSGLSPYYQYSRLNNLVKSFYVNNLKAVDVEGIEPSNSWVTNRSPRQVTPTASSLYQSNKNTSTNVAYAKEPDPTTYVYQGKWVAHDTINKEYITTITAVNIRGRASVTQVSWWDDTETVMWSGSWLYDTQHWLSGYSYRKQITISHSNSTGAGTDYQVKLTIDSNGGSANVDLGGHCSNFPQDIRFTDNDETTELDYWIEDTSADPITVWVKVDDSLESSNADIYVYYGKSGDSTTSNGTNTFIFYDDFDSDNWTDAGANIYVDTENSRTYFKADRGATADYTYVTENGDYNWEIRILDFEFTGYSTAAYHGAIASIGFSENAETSRDARDVSSADFVGCAPYRDTPQSGNGYCLMSWIVIDGVLTGGTKITGLAQDTQYEVAIRRAGSAVSVLVYDSNGDLVGSSSGTYSGSATLGYIVLSNFNDNTGTDYVEGLIDTTFVRKYASTEPAFSSVGSEEGAGYLYRKKISLTGQTGAGTNYQVRLLIGESSGADGEDFDLGGHCQDDFDDIRFTDNDGTTLLDYWIESTSGTTPNQLATVWVEVADSLESGTVPIYIYYGNSGASSASSGDDTFLFFDNFPGTSLDTEKWTETISESGSGYSVADSIIHLWAGSGINREQIISDTSFSAPVALRMRAKLEVTAAANQNTRSGFFVDGGNGRAMVNSYQGTHYFQCIDNDGNADNNDIGATYFGDYKIYDIMRVGGVGKLNVNGVSVISDGDMDPDAVAQEIEMYVRDTEYDLWVDWVAVRKYASTEPAFSSVGSETMWKKSDAPGVSPSGGGFLMF